jgi:hypothetical protein
MMEETNAGFLGNVSNVCASRSDEQLLAICDRRVKCDLALYRQIFDRCFQLTSIVSLHRDSSLSGILLARAIVNLLRAYYKGVKTGLEAATYVRYALIASGCTDIDASIRDAVYGEGGVLLHGDEFAEMDQQLGDLVLGDESSCRVSVTCRPVTLFFQGQLELRGLFTKRILEDEAQTLAYEQLSAYKFVSEADLSAYRERMAERQRQLEVQAALERQRQEEARREFQRRNRY